MDNTTEIVSVKILIGLRSNKLNRDGPQLQEPPIFLDETKIRTCKTHVGNELTY